MRGRWEIFLDILKGLENKNRSRKTKIMQMAFLDWRTFKKYFKFLRENGYIEKCGNPGNEYKITEKGRELLEELEKVESITGRAE